MTAAPGDQNKTLSSEFVAADGPSDTRSSSSSLRERRQEPERDQRAGGGAVLQTPASEGRLKNRHDHEDDFWKSHF